MSATAKWVAAVALAAALVVIAGCGASCTRERSTVEGLREIVSNSEGAERETGEATLEAAEEALSACEDRERGEWLEQIVSLLVKVAISAASN